jgi:integrase
MFINELRHPGAPIESIFQRNIKRARSQRTGHLFETSGSWYLRYRVDTPTLGPNGRPIRKRLTVLLADSKGPGAISKREAGRIAWNHYLSRLDASSIRPGSMVTVEQFFKQRFWPDWESTLKPSWRSSFKSLVNKYVLAHLGSLQLRDVTFGHCQQMVAAMSSASLSSQTIRHARNILVSILKHAKRLGVLTGELPTEGLRLPSKRVTERRALTWAQVCAISIAVSEVIADRDPSWKVGRHAHVIEREAAEISILVLFLATTGLRIGEAMGLRWSRVNLTDQAIVVEGALLPSQSFIVKENWVMGKYSTLKTPSSYRIVPIPQWVVELLIPMQSRKEFVGPQDPVWASSKGTPIDQTNTAKRILKPAAMKASVPDVSWHVLRHTSATLADQFGLSVSERQKVLGHVSAAQTLSYTHPEIERVRKQMDSLNPNLIG